MIERCQDPVGEIWPPASVVADIPDPEPASP